MPNFLLEVGTEELPASFVDSAIAQWRSRIPQSLTNHNLTAEAIEVYGTPRRLAVLIKGLPSQQPDRDEEIKGPPAQAAFKDGKPTKAAEGFAKKQGVELDALEIRPTDKGEFVFVRVSYPGRPVAEILSQLVPEWIFGLEGKRFMRWGDGDLKFSRPIVWLVALLDTEVLPIQIENSSEIIKSDRISWGHRVLHPATVSIPQATDYVSCLRSAFVDVEVEQRKAKIEAQVNAIAQQLNGSVTIYPELLAEVTNLVEWSTAVVGKFDSEFLNLPPEVITTVMVSHQRYFPIFQVGAHSRASLLPNFITISNGDPAKSDIIAAGNERVIRARLADGQFFYKTDLAKPLESYLLQLEKVTFQEDLGSVGDKVGRIISIAQQINEQLQVSQQERHQIERAASLCKADLVTQMVFEFPELQGVMGQKYAIESGESETVATAIFEHYLPRNAGDRLPETLAGQVVGVADRLDTIVSIFGLGMLPTGSSDPFALRRAANAIVSIIWAANLSINLYQLLEQTARDFIKTYAKTSMETLNASLQEFFIQRIRTLLQEERSIDYDLVNAVLGESDAEYRLRALQDLLDVRDRALFLQSIRNNGTLDKIYETVNRSTRLAAQGDLDFTQLQPENLVKPKLFQKSSEQAFYDALLQLVPQTQAARESRNYQQLVDALIQIAPTVSNFFDGEQSVLVMDADPEIRRNRLNLLGLLRNHARVLANFGEIVKN
ncbi:MAG: Glycine--tRNA ligase beta subunit [Chroococcidiopsis cubana SAG 39.79]|jgi:glycyl-tRNA synthetase beta chain|uniref:Glycine--tRNA ligase beta subunit n=1 Tax=Chroococcidiopsis cubana SAG 39.79 TaxID=388085 RepID=A0AB37UFF3_9CYAN|nr:glycine--tRNA ligase subunit beta [Chroococcidiopsis cubana]MDZ4872995.1 Glycine--tRNA ligase beta subunit [Chroococcidiopsis cubana SAG 39.79]PSB47709.1 glycine--tRNA ligase subunit beta [Cyanosarcina cf. burmensis CCALA 770]PSB66230.1 glycine--tRNA ligase subunit beta [Chroococcidiopsis cubana CCALA 043]RUT08738.1 glycine--tRNA ligase beta subunit [Chroococcidiopsis cubana SAG 39.79]